jgi:cyclic pyranopterin phosphate synthase
MKGFADKYGRRHTYLRISVTQRCNLDCVYCRRTDTGALDPLSFEEIERVTRLFAEGGVEKIRITGGEPLMREGLPDLVSRLVKIPGIRTVGLTTNGVLLNERIDALKAAGLTHLNISLDALRASCYEKITSSPHHARVMEGIFRALHEGFTPLKINVVVIRGVNDAEIPDFVAFTKTRPVHVRFIEFMPFRDNGWRPELYVPADEIMERIEAEHRLTPEPVLSTSRDFRVQGFQGRIGIISPMSKPFCKACNRLRITSDGTFKACLFSKGELNLTSLLRDGVDDRFLGESLRKALMLKPEAHPRTGEEGSMQTIGG